MTACGLIVERESEFTVGSRRSSATTVTGAKAYNARIKAVNNNRRDVWRGESNNDTGPAGVSMAANVGASYRRDLHVPDHFTLSYASVSIVLPATASIRSLTKWTKGESRDYALSRFVTGMAMLMRPYLK
jgi:hypothetical protein